MNDKLFLLVTCLNNQQVKVARSYLNAFASRGNEHTLLCRLFNAILKNPYQTSKYYSELVYGKVNEGAIVRLSSRLHYKLLDTLLIDINVSRMFESADHNMAMVVIVRKMLLQFYILRVTAQGRKVGTPLLIKALRISEKYEFYSVRLEILNLLKGQSTAIGGRSTYKNWDSAIKEATDTYAAYLRAFDWYNKYQELHGYQGNLTPEQLIQFLKKAVEGLTSDYLQYQSPTVKYFLGYMETALYEQQGNFETAILKCKENLELLNRYESVKTQARISNQYSNIAIMEFQMGRLSEALKYNTLSIDVSLKNSPDMQYKLIQRAEILYHLGSFNSAMEIIDDLFNSVVGLSELLKAKAEVLKACLHFAAGQFKEAAILVGQKFVLSSDKAGRELFVRIFRVMIFTELHKKEEAETAFENLLRYLQRNKNKYEVPGRTKLIVKIFGELIKTGLDFSNINEPTMKKILHLNSDPEYMWRYGTAELIPIDLWLESKLRKKRGPKPGQKKKSNA